MTKATQRHFWHSHIKIPCAYLSGGKKEPLLLGEVAAEGGRRGLKDAPLTRLRRELSQRESLFTFIYAVSIFLTSTAIVDTNAKYGIPLSRYTAFLYNCPLGYDPKSWSFFNEAHLRRMKRVAKQLMKQGFAL